MKVLVAGDFYPQFRVKEKFLKNQYSDVLANTKLYTSNHDLSIVNLETPILYANKEYIPIEKNGPNLRSDDSSLKALRYAGFNLLTLANNHIMDYGETGLKDTVDICKQYNFDLVGVGENINTAANTYSYENNNEVLSIINCCEHESSIASEVRSGSNPLSPIRQYYQIKKAKQKSDYVIVIVHGGHELLQLPSLRMIETYRFFIDAGADVVINHHQHCYSGYEIYKSKPIFYGLGNFCFDKQCPISSWYEGFLVSINLDKCSINFELHPYEQCKENPSINFLMNKTNFEKSILELNRIIADESKLRDCLNNFYNKTQKDILFALEPYSGILFRKLYYRGLLPTLIKRKKVTELLNYVECESHLDKLIKILNNKKS